MTVFSWNDMLHPEVNAAAFFSAGDAGSCPGTDISGAECSETGSALTVGGFDGPHRGHDALFEAVLSYRNGRQGIKAGAVTFILPPGAVTRRRSFPGEISTLKMKLDAFEAKGLDFAVVIDFSDDFSKIKGTDFLSILKDSCSMQFLAAGSDFRCGHNLDTGVAGLADFSRQHGVQFSVIDEVMYNGRRISSSAIRQCVLTGDFGNASGQLGQPYSVDCTGVRWYASKTHPGAIEAARGLFAQILPPVGEYAVCVEYAGSALFNTVLTAESNFLRLEIPPEQDVRFVKKIVF